MSDSNHGPSQASSGAPATIDGGSPFRFALRGFLAMPLMIASLLFRALALTLYWPAVPFVLYRYHISLRRRLNSTPQPMDAEV